MWWKKFSCSVITFQKCLKVSTNHVYVKTSILTPVEHEVKTFQGVCRNLRILLVDLAVHSIFSLNAKLIIFPVDIYLFKASNGRMRTTSWSGSGVFIVDLDQFHTLFWCVHCWVWTSKWRLGLDGILLAKWYPQTWRNMKLENIMLLSIWIPILRENPLLTKLKWI